MKTQSLLEAVMSCGGKSKKGKEKKEMKEKYKSGEKMPPPKKKS